MNRAFKVEFYGNNGVGKNIFTLSCSVISGKRFKEMNENDKIAALKVIETWERSLQGFKDDLRPKQKAKVTVLGDDKQSKYIKAQIATTKDYSR